MKKKIITFLNSQKIDLYKNQPIIHKSYRYSMYRMECIKYQKHLNMELLYQCDWLAEILRYVFNQNFFLVEMSTSWYTTESTVNWDQTSWHVLFETTLQNMITFYVFENSSIGTLFSIFCFCQLVSDQHVFRTRGKILVEWTGPSGLWTSDQMFIIQGYNMMKQYHILTMVLGCLMLFIYGPLKAISHS